MTMSPSESPADLERRVHRALRALPGPRAPHSLAPRVMAAIAAAARAPVGWRRWPLHYQLLSVVAACSLVLVLALGLPLVEAWVAGLTAARMAAALWQTLVAPIAASVIVLIAVMGTACALLFAALKHVAWEGQEASRS
jgi:hypothetical protein